MRLAQQVRAKTDLDSGSLGPLKGLQAGLADVVDFVNTDLWQAPLFAFTVERFIGHQGRHQKGSRACHQRRGLLVDELTMLNGAYAEAYTARNGLWRVGVRHDVGAPGARFPDYSTDLVFGVLQIPHGIGRGCHTP